VIEVSELDGFLIEGAPLILAAQPLIQATRPEVVFHLGSKAFGTTDLCALRRVKLSFLMPTEISIPDAEDLKSRVRELRRFL